MYRVVVPVIMNMSETDRQRDRQTDSNADGTDWWARLISERRAQCSRLASLLTAAITVTRQLSTPCRDSAATCRESTDNFCTTSEHEQPTSV